MRNPYLPLVCKAPPATPALSLIVLSCILLGASRSEAQIAFTDFSDLSPLTLNGQAAVIHPGGAPLLAGGQNVLRLTDSWGQAGSAFFTDPFVLDPLDPTDESFQCYFQFQITDIDQGADGLAFCLQSEGPTALGGGGSSAGFGTPGPIVPSLVVLFHTYPSSGVSLVVDAVNVVGGMSLPTPLDNGAVWHVWLDYDGITDMLDIRLSSTAEHPPLPTLLANIELAVVLGTNVWAGFTAGTGGFASIHDVRSWQFDFTTPPPFVCTIPTATSPHPWPTYHHDTQRTGRSGFYGPLAPNVDWVRTLSSSELTSPIVAESGHVYVVTDGLLCAIDPDLPDPVWTFPSSFSPPSLDTAGNLYVSVNNYLYSLDACGQVRWFHATPGFQAGPALVLSSGDVMYIAGFSGSAVLIRLTSNGVLVYEQPLPQWSGGTLTASHDELQVYNSVPVYTLYAFDALTGTSLWAGNLGWPITTIPVVDDSGHVFVGSRGFSGIFFGGLFRGFDSLGQLILSFGSICGNTTPTVLSGSRILYSDWNSLVCGNVPLQSGCTGSWPSPVNPPGTFLHAAPISDAQDRVYVTSTTGHLICLAADGSELWQYDASAPGLSTSPAIAGPGLLYLSTNDGRLVRIEAQIPPSPPSPPGVTVICHGFQFLPGSYPGWIDAMDGMASAINDRVAAELGVSGAFGNVLKYNPSTGGWILVTSESTQNYEEELVLLFDWTRESGALPFTRGPNEFYVQAAGDALFSALMDARVENGLPMPAYDPLQPGAGTSILKRSDGSFRRLHLIGHSRGVGVVSEAAQRLLLNGVPIDQLTGIDSHPVNGQHCEDRRFTALQARLGVALSPGWGDPVPKAWSGISFVDSYFRKDATFNGGSLEDDCHESCLSNDLFAGSLPDFLNPLQMDTDFDGEEIFGTIGLMLSIGDGAVPDPDSCGVLDCANEHKKAHAWYHGTIIGSQPVVDSCSIEYANWYFGDSAGRGYAYSAAVEGWEEARQSWPAPTPTPLPLNVPSVLFNGRFTSQLSGKNGTQAGWRYHGGSGTDGLGPLVSSVLPEPNTLQDFESGEIGRLPVSGVGAESGSNAFARLGRAQSAVGGNKFGSALIHNRFFLPDWVDEFRFCYSVAQIDQSSANDSMLINLIDLEDTVTTLCTLPLTAETTWTPHTVDLDGVSLGRTYRLELLLLDGAADGVRTDVLIDSLDFVTSSTPLVPCQSDYQVTQGQLDLIAGTVLDFQATFSGDAVSETIFITLLDGATATFDAEIPDFFSATPPPPWSIGGGFPLTSSMAVTLTYEATQLGSQSGVLMLTSEDPQVPIFNLTLTGTTIVSGNPEIAILDGNQEPLLANPRVVLLDPTLIGESVSVEYFLRNDGDTPLLGVDVVVETPFQLDLAPSATIDPGVASALAIMLPPQPVGEYSGVVEVWSSDSDENPFQIIVVVSVVDPQVHFIRGDANSDSVVDIGDPISVLSYLFASGPAGCLDGKDANDDGQVDIGDAVYSLSFLFSQGPNPASPYPGCGVDVTSDSIGCSLQLPCP